MDGTKDGGCDSGNAPRRCHQYRPGNGFLGRWSDSLRHRSDPWRGVPGAYWFTEAYLAQYADLEEAYTQFKIEITGGETRCCGSCARMSRQSVVADLLRMLESRMAKTTSNPNPQTVVREFLDSRPRCSL
jgi:hypothetical protein